MSQTKHPVNDDNLWRDLYTSEMAFIKARMKFFADCQDKVAVIRKALHIVTQRGTALRIVLNMKIEERQQLLDDLLSLASVSHSDLALTRDVLFSLPREWLLTNIEARAEPLLRNGTDEEYRRLLELYAELDLNLARTLAWRALKQDNADIREVGEDFMNRLEGV